MFNMGRRILVLLLIIQKATGQTTTSTGAPTVASANCDITCMSHCDCSSKGLSSVPQYLPTFISSLLLDNNAITTLNQSDFSRYSRLNWIILNHNHLTSLQADTFAGLINLWYLDLGNNYIHIIEVDAFLNLPSLQELILSHNSLHVFPLTVYDIFANIPTIDISNNPWQCDCRMLPFKQDMTGVPAFEKQIRCAGPANLAGKSLLYSVDAEDLNCSSFSLPVFLSSFLGVIGGILLTLSVFLIIWCRNKTSKTSPVPAPDTHVTSGDRDQTGHDVTETGTAESDDVERGSAHGPDPYGLDLGYRIVRPPLPPIPGAEP
ncbi:uncharacterized protein LOC144866140 [Branchiostoma floridae x Branchiostoma japonicum]